MAALTFLELLLNKHNFRLDDYQNHFGDIAKLLSNFQLCCEAKEVREKTMSIVMYILESKKAHINLNSFLEETTDCEFLKPLREDCKSSQPNIDRADVANYLRSFLLSPTPERLRDLRTYVSNKLIF